MQARVQRAGDSTTSNDAHALLIQPVVDLSGRDHSAGFAASANSSALQVRRYFPVKYPFCSAVAVVEDTEIGQERGSLVM